MSVTSNNLSSPNMFNTASPKSLSNGAANPFCSDRFAPLKFSAKESRIPDQAPSASPISNLTKDINSSLFLESVPNSPDLSNSNSNAPLLKMLDHSLGAHTPRMFKRKFDLDSSIEDSSFGMMMQANSPSALVSSHRERRPIRSTNLAKSSGLAQAEDVFMGGFNSPSCRALSANTDDEDASSFDENDTSLLSQSYDSTRQLGHRRQRSLTLSLDADSNNVVATKPEKGWPQMGMGQFSPDCSVTPTAPMKRARSQGSAILKAQPAPPPCFPSANATMTVSSPRSPECGILPCQSAPTDTIKRIDASTLTDLLSGRYSDKYDEHLVVDCRFPYEYQGGHIKGAANAPTIECLEKLLLERPISDKKMIIVLHCEYSIQRAPSMASHLRRRDRELNTHRYPQLHYPEIYVLKGGYRNFFNNGRKEFCYPQNYVEMNDAAYTEDCRQRMANFNREFKRAKSVNDASIRSFGCSPVAQNGASGLSFARPASKLSRTRSIRPSRTIPSASPSTYPTLSFGNANGTSNNSRQQTSSSSHLSSFRIFP